MPLKYQDPEVDRLVNQMYRTGFTQDGVNEIYQRLGLGAAPTVPSGLIGRRPGAGRASNAILDSNGRPVQNGNAGGVRDFLNDFGRTALDPYRVQSGISKVAGGVLNAVGTAVGGPVWTAMTGAANVGNKALGNTSSSSDFGEYGTIGGLIGAGYNMAGAPGSYAARTAEAAGASGRIDESGAMGGGGNGSGGFGGMAGETGWGGWLDTILDIAPDLLGAYLGADAAGDAARMQQQGSREAIAETRRQYDQTRADLAPFREAGYGALGQINTGLVNGGDFNRDFTIADFQKDPGYQFRMDEGRSAIEGSRAASGGLFSGATGKALQRYGQDYASNEYSNAYNRFNNDRNQRFNRLASVAGIGQTATNTTVNAGANAARDVADSVIGGANAAAAGRVGQANAYMGGLESLGNYYRSRRYGT